MLTLLTQPFLNGHNRIIIRRHILTQFVANFETFVYAGCNLSPSNQVETHYIILDTEVL